MSASMRVEGDYQRDGAVCVRGAFDSSDIDLATRAIEANLTSPSPLAQRASREDDGAFVEDFRSWRRIPELEEFIRNSPAARIAGELMGSDSVRLYHDHVLSREAGTAQRTPWHQDLPYYNVEGSLNLSMWIPVDRVDSTSTLELIAGSHLGPWYMPRSFLDEQAKWFGEGSLAELPDIEGHPEIYRVLRWSLDPGDAVCFHMLSLHAAGGTSSRRRRVLSLRFLGDDMVHAPRSWTTSPPFPGLEDELPAGSPLDHPLFPLLWERA